MRLLLNIFVLAFILDQPGSTFPTLWLWGFCVAGHCIGFLQPGSLNSSQSRLKSWRSKKPFGWRGQKTKRLASIPWGNRIFLFICGPSDHNPGQMDCTKPLNIRADSDRTVSDQNGKYYITSGDMIFLLHEGVPLKSSADKSVWLLLLLPFVSSELFCDPLHPACVQA